MKTKPKSKPQKAENGPHKLNLALQGGGTHGAFTWGVIDRLLEEKDIELHAVSGTSAGAMNGAVLATGYTKGGREGAKQALFDFWQDVSFTTMASSAIFQPSALDAMSGGYNLKWSPGYNAFDLLSRIFSPYQLNPLNLNPLRDILERHVDLKTMERSKIHLFVAATSVESGRARVFHCHDMSIDALLASACIPFLFQAVQIGEESYWDGGYVGNPVIWPLIYHTHVSDIMLIQINPLNRAEVPKTAYDIINRLNEITFNSSLIAEMRAINFVTKLVHDNKLDPDKYRDVRMHMVASGLDIKNLDASSKMNPRWDFFLYLRDRGREQADGWLKEYKGHLGKHASLNIEETFLGTSRREPTTPKGKKKAA